MTKKHSYSLMIALSFYLTLPIFNLMGIRYFGDAWIFNKASILIVFFIFVTKLSKIIKLKINTLIMTALAICIVFIFSYIQQTLYGFDVEIKTNNTHILLISFFLLYFILKTTTFDISNYIFKPALFASLIFAVIYIIDPDKMRALSVYATNIIGVNSIFVDREFRFSSFFSEPSKLAIFSGIALFYYIERREKFMSSISALLLILSMSKFAIVFVPVCIVLSLLFRKMSLNFRIVVMFLLLTGYLIFLMQYSEWFKFLYSIANYESLNTYETRFGFPIIALYNLAAFPFGVGVFDGYRYILLTGDFTIGNYCHELVNYGGNCYEMNSYGLNSLAEFFPKDILSTSVFYFGFFGVVLVFTYGYFVSTKISINYYRYTPLYIFLCLLFVTSYDYMIIVLSLMLFVVHKNKDVMGEKI